MRTTALGRAVLAAMVVVLVAVAPAARAQDNTFDFTIDAARLAADRHTVVVSGTYTCGPFDTTGGVVDLTVRQDRTVGFGFAPILTCDGKVQAYQADVVSNSDRRFKPGAARASASGYVEDETTQIDGQRIVITRR
jgi:hypothetical protein